jgi:hypothetical protein
MAENELINPASWAEKLKDKIRGEIAGLLPDEALKAAIEAEVRLFTEGVAETKDRWGRTVGRREPALRVLVRSVLEEHVRTKLREELTEHQRWNTGWDGVVSEAAVKIARESHQYILEGMVAQMVQQTLSNMQAPDGSGSY